VREFIETQNSLQELKGVLNEILSEDILVQENLQLKSEIKQLKQAQLKQKLSDNNWSKIYNSFVYFHAKYIVFYRNVFHFKLVCVMNCMIDKDQIDYVVLDLEKNLFHLYKNLWES